MMSITLIYYLEDETKGKLYFLATHKRTFSKIIVWGGLKNFSNRFFFGGGMGD